MRSNRWDTAALWLVAALSASTQSMAKDTAPNQNTTRKLTFTLDPLTSERLYNDLEMEKNAHFDSDSQQYQSTARGTLHCLANEESAYVHPHYECKFFPEKANDEHYSPFAVSWYSKHGDTVAQTLMEKMQTYTVLDHGQYRKKEYVQFFCTNFHGEHKCRAAITVRDFFNLAGMPCSPSFDRPAPHLRFVDHQWVETSYYDDQAGVTIESAYRYTISSDNTVTFWQGQEIAKFKIVQQGNFLIPTDMGKHANDYYRCYANSLEDKFRW